MRTLDVAGHGVAAVGEDAADAAYPVAQTLTATQSATTGYEAVGNVRILVEVLRRHGGIAPRALLGAEFIAGNGPSTLIEVGVASFGMLESDDQPTCRSRLWNRPFVSGLPTELASAVLRGLTARPHIVLPPGVLRVDRAGFDVMNSSEKIFTQTAALLSLAISAKLRGDDPEPGLRAAIESW
ncbi:hypothetical protein GCM10027088_43690 [Nocardia goodfellowii]